MFSYYIVLSTSPDLADAADKGTAAEEEEGQEQQEIEVVVFIANRSGSTSIDLNPPWLIC